MLSITTEIRHVTVFREGALIRRVGTVEPKDGSTSRISVLGLPLRMDDGSVRAGFIGDAGAESAVRDIHIVLNLPGEDGADAGADQKELKDARRRVLKLHRQLEDLQGALERIRDIPWPERLVPEDPGRQHPSSVEGRAEFASYLDGRYSDLMERRRSVRTELKEAQEQEALLIDREARRTTARQARIHELRKGLEVSFHGNLPSDRSMELFVEYLVPGARWVPAYELRFDADFRRSDLTRRALVAQGSGEDWRGVGLTLSTAVPARMYDLPELSSRRIGRKARSKATPGWTAPPTGSDSLLSDFKRFAEEADMDRPAPPEPAPEDEVFGAEAEEEFFDDEVMDRQIEMRKSRAEMDVIGADIEESAFEAPAESAPAVSAPMASKKMRRSEAPALDIESRSPAKPAPRRDGSEELSVEGIPDYGILRLESPRSSLGTRLRASSKREQYMEMVDDLTEDERSSLADVVAGMETAESASTFADPPDQCRFPSAIDGYDFSFDADAPVSVDSDRRFHAVRLNEHALVSRIRYVSVPRLDSHVFGMVELENGTGAPLLPGPVDVRVESDFLCRGAFDVVPDGAEAELGIGVEGGIKVARNARFSEETSGITGGSLSLHHEIRIEAVNNLNRSVDLEIRERIPTKPGDQDKIDEKVKIEIGSVVPEWTSFDQDPAVLDGGYRWTVELKRGEERSFEVDYDIRIPSNMEIPDGNNREAE